MHQIRFRLGFRPRSRRGAYSAPQNPLAGFRGLLLRGGKGKGSEKRGEGNGGQHQFEKNDPPSSDGWLRA